jgi:membrane protease YdiL (CAAX protease family)
MEPTPDATQPQPILQPAGDAPLPPPSAAPASLAPAWHTAVLILVIAVLSFAGSLHAAQSQVVHNRFVTYAATGVMELLMLAWVAFGLRLRRIPLRTLFGHLASGPHAFFADLIAALIFWIGALMVLGTVGMMWTGIEALLTRGSAPWHAAAPFAPVRTEASRAVLQVAPSTLREAAAWALLCLIVGIVEESVFRGYFQGQFTAWAHGNVAFGILFSAVLFGAAHGYQGLRSMFLLVIFGALFSALALFRRSLRPCIFAHSWHDLIAGLALGVLKLHHLA